MPDFTDPFDRIVASSGMGEWPDPGFETIPPYKVALLQEALVDHMVAADAHLRLEEPEFTLLLAQLQRMLEYDFERLGIVDIGDIVKFSRNGIVLSVDETGEHSGGMIDDTTCIKGQITRPVVMEVPMMESLRLGDDQPEPVGDKPVLQLAACLELTDVVVQDGSSDEEPLDETAIMTYVPLVYDGMKIQRKL